MSDSSSHPAKPLLGFLSFALVAGGVTGILREIFDWGGALFGFFRHLIPDGHEYFGYSVLVVLGAAVGIASSRLRQPEG